MEQGPQKKKSRWIEYTKEDVQEVYEQAKSYIQNEFGITLSTIELARLREVAKEVVQDVSLQEIEYIKNGIDTQSNFNPWDETPSRFLTVFYGLSPKIMKIYQDDEEAVKEWVRRKQAELHMP